MLIELLTNAEGGSHISISRFRSMITSRELNVAVVPLSHLPSWNRRHAKTMWSTMGIFFPPIVLNYHYISMHSLINTFATNCFVRLPSINRCHTWHIRLREGNIAACRSWFSIGLDSDRVRARVIINNVGILQEEEGKKLIREQDTLRNAILCMINNFIWYKRACSSNEKKDLVNIWTLDVHARISRRKFSRCSRITYPQVDSSCCSARDRFTWTEILRAINSTRLAPVGHRM